MKANKAESSFFQVQGDYLIFGTLCNSIVYASTSNNDSTCQFGSYTNSEYTKNNVFISYDDKKIENSEHRYDHNNGRVSHSTAACSFFQE